MSTAKKITSLVLALSLACLAISVEGQILKQPKIKHKKRSGTTIGFRSGHELLFNSPSINNKRGKIRTGINNSMVLRKPIGTHLSLEGAISYRAFQTTVPNNLNDKSPANKYNSTPKTYSLALPVTVNYFLFPGKCKLHPYIGAGFQYNLNLNNNNSSISLSSADIKIPDNQQQGTKYISILFTQGITFQINTKIQVTQSFHFLPENSNKVIGIDLGIGYQLP